MYTFLFYFLLFICYSFLGWLTEVTFIKITQKRITNRGFLIGPYCPIYGVGALAIHFTLGNFQNNVILLFFLTAICVTAIEYITSYIMEKLFKARWWDYSNEFLNINGRVCLTHTIMFGILGILFMYFISPTFINLFSNSNEKALMVLSSFILILFSIDLIISFNVVKKLKITTENIRKDYTDEISERVRDALMTNSKLTKRLIKAFPNLKTISNIIKNGK